MIPVPRSAKPRVLQRNSAKWLIKLRKEQAEYQTLKRDPTAKESDIRNAKKRFDDTQSKFGHSEIKNALESMFNGKCAYCESKITVVTYGAIEHFFPKSIYIDLTFDWSNLLLS